LNADWLTEVRRAYASKVAPEVVEIEKNAIAYEKGIRERTGTVDGVVRLQLHRNGIEDPILASERLEAFPALTPHDESWYKTIIAKDLEDRRRKDAFLQKEETPFTTKNEIGIPKLVEERKKAADPDLHVPGADDSPFEKVTWDKSKGYVFPDGGRAIYSHYDADKGEPVYRRETA